MINSRKIGDIKNSSFSDNVNLQSDNVTQTNLIKNPEIQTALENLKEKIKSIPDEDLVEEGHVHYDMLVRYLEENKPKRAGKCLESLKDIVGTAKSLVVIASQLGILL